MTLMRRLRIAPVLKHIVSGTRTVLLENLLGDSDLQLWDGVSLQELLKMIFQATLGCNCVPIPAPVQN